MMKDKEEADQRLSEVLAWWDNQGSVPAPTSLELENRSVDPPVRIAWKAPFYRVRVGPYRSRGQAKKALTAIRPSFPDAFIALEQLQSAQ